MLVGGERNRKHQLIVADQSSLGLKREQVAAADLTRQVQQIQVVAKETHNEARRLAAAIDTLNGDRDRLYSRVTSLEQGLDSVTGAIARQGSAAASPPAANAEPQAAQNPQPSPAVAPVATTQATAPAADKSTSATTSEPGPAAVYSAAKDAAKTDAVKAESAKLETAKADAAGSGVPSSAVYHSLRSVVVLPGQSLWSIATQYDPGSDPRNVIQEIIDLNALSGTSVQPGERLWLPRG